MTCPACVDLPACRCGYVEKERHLQELRALRRRYRWGWGLPPIIGAIGAGLIAAGVAGPVLGMTMMLVALAGPPLLLVGGLGDRRVTKQLRAAEAPLQLPAARVVPAKKRNDDAVEVENERERTLSHE